MYSQLFMTKRHSRSLILILFHTYVTISAPHQGREQVVLSLKPQGWAGGAACRDTAHTSLSRAKSMCLAQTQPKMPTFLFLCNIQRVFCGIPEGHCSY